MTDYIHNFTIPAGGKVTLVTRANGNIVIKNIDVQHTKIMHAHVVNRAGEKRTSVDIPEGESRVVGCKRNQSVIVESEGLGKGQFQFHSNNQTIAKAS